MEIDQECIKDFGNFLVLEDDNHQYRGHLEQAEKDEKEDPSFQDGNDDEVVELWRKKTETFLKRLGTIPILTMMINVQIFSHDKVMTCYNMTDTGLLALVSLLAGTALKCLHDLLQSCRDSRCKKIKVCCLTCNNDNEILTGQELRELQDVPANTDRDENSINV